MTGFRTIGSAVVAIALVVCALYCWQMGPHWVFDADQPVTALWAVRSGAVAAAALGQAFILLGVVGNLYRARMADVVARFVAAGIFVVASVGAIALGLAAR